MKRIFSILFALVLALSLTLVLAAPAALAYQEGPGTDWWYIDASYGGYHNSVPLVIELDGDSSAGQIFYVSDTITISGDLHAVAQSCGGDGNGAYTEWLLEVDGPSGSDSTGDWNYDHSSGCAVADEDTTLEITYELTAPGTHTVYMSSYAAVSQYWTDVADDFAEDSLTFEVELAATPMASFDIDHAKLDFKKKPDDDKVRVKGKLELGVASNGVDISDPVSEPVTVTVGSLSPQTIVMEQKGKKGEKWEYKRPKGESGIKHMKIDWKKYPEAKFDIRVDKVDLGEMSDWTNPVTISIQIGDDVGSESILMRVKKHHWDYKAKKHH